MHVSDGRSPHVLGLWAAVLSVCWHVIYYYHIIIIHFLQSALTQHGPLIRFEGYFSEQSSKIAAIIPPSLDHWCLTQILHIPTRIPKC